MDGYVLRGKVALVTGASRGIGRGIALGLAEAGATIYLTGRSIGSENCKDAVGGSLAETSAAVEQAGGRAIAVPTDHSDDDQVGALFERIRIEQNGQLDVLVNNAYGGVRKLGENRHRSFWNAELGLWDACNNVGLRSHYIASVLAARLMTDRHQGLICTISSWGGLSPLFGVAYGVGKSGCDRMAADMALELKPFNVASISLWPGIVGTELMQAFVSAGLDRDLQDERLAGMASHYNWESPLLTGRVIAALATDPGTMMKRTGKVQIVAELAHQLGVVEANGMQPASLRSLRFILPFKFAALQNYAALIPDLRVPWWALLLTALSAPRI